MSTTEYHHDTVLHDMERHDNASDAGSECAWALVGPPSQSSTTLKLMAKIYGLVDRHEIDALEDPAAFTKEFFRVLKIALSDAENDIKL